MEKNAISHAMLFIVGCVVVRTDKTEYMVMQVRGWGQELVILLPGKNKSCKLIALADAFWIFIFIKSGRKIIQFNIVFDAGIKVRTFEPSQDNLPIRGWRSRFPAPPSITWDCTQWDFQISPFLSIATHKGPKLAYIILNIPSVFL